MWIIQTKICTSARREGTFHFTDLADLGEDSTPLGSDALLEGGQVSSKHWIQMHCLEDVGSLSCLKSTTGLSKITTIQIHTVHPCNYSLHAEQSRHHE